MATLRNKGKLAALNKENCEELPRRYLAQNSNVPRSHKDFITQVSEEVEGRFTKNLSQEFSTTANLILGALSRLDDFLMNPLIQDHSGTAPETSRNAFSTSQVTNEDDSQSDRHPEAGIFNNQTTQNSDPEDGHDTFGSGSNFPQASQTCFDIYGFKSCSSVNIMYILQLFAIFVNFELFRERSILGKIVRSVQHVRR